MISVQRITNPTKLEIAFSIRKEVFVEEQHVPLEEEYDEFEETSIHFLAFIDNKAVGTARIRTTEKGIKLERFCVLKNYRKMGVGKSLVNKLLNECNNFPKSQVYLYAQKIAQNFYSKFGFEAKGEIFLDAGIEHIEMQYKEK
ncbi:MAG: GNAT family N-acetyltransferase [Leptospiraceae bacterium]|nr:GNAT family N-acetyltransferase [Leptospiraceae bacterium]